jgi:hypothetical protein
MRFEKKRNKKITVLYQHMPEGTEENNVPSA